MYTEIMFPYIIIIIIIIIYIDLELHYIAKNADVILNLLQ